MLDGSCSMCFTLDNLSCNFSRNFLWRHHLPLDCLQSPIFPSKIEDFASLAAILDESQIYLGRGSTYEIKMVACTGERSILTI